LLLVAKTDRAHHDLSRQFQAREIEKTYVAFVWGKPKAATGLIDRALGRNPKNRKRISSRVRGGREAVTEYRLVKTWGAISLLELRPKTGRTHQIRVHLAEIGHSIVGDPVYGRGVKKLGDFPETIQDKLKSFPFQLLHALTLSFVHPETGERMAITAPVRKEMAEFEGELDQWINSSRT
jgi:23S rRNA pseudouridine1911/1915/1917 synthase